MHYGSVHRLDRIIANIPAKLLDSKSLTLAFACKQIWPVYLCDSPGTRSDAGRARTLPSIQSANFRRCGPPTDEQSSSAQATGMVQGGAGGGQQGRRGL